MSSATALVLACLAPLTLYMASRIIFSAYFAAKHTYQRRLFAELEGAAEHGKT